MDGKHPQQDTGIVAPKPCSGQQKVLKSPPLPGPCPAERDTGAPGAQAGGETSGGGHGIREGEGWKEPAPRR